MSKTIKKMMALVIAMVMMVAMSTISVFAADSFTITIDNAVAGETYSAY